jgi:response regulator RpfG family c-di-GMP phosphodiesterase
MAGWRPLLACDNAERISFVESLVSIRASIPARKGRNVAEVLNRLHHVNPENQRFPYQLTSRKCDRTKHVAETLVQQSKVAERANTYIRIESGHG